MMVILGVFGRLLIRRRTTVDREQCPAFVLRLSRVEPAHAIAIIARRRYRKSPVFMEIPSDRFERRLKQRFVAVLRRFCARHRRDKHGNNGD